MPLLRNPDKSKLSKRKNPTSIKYYRAMGYLPQALVNYLGLMGWSLPSGDEKFSVQDMTAAFDISRVSLGGPVFDMEKLDWLNGKYIREDLDDERFVEEFSRWAFSQERLERMVPLIKQRVERFSDVAELGNLFIKGLTDLTTDSFTHKSLDTDTIIKILQFTLWRLEQIPEWEREAIQVELRKLADGLQLKIRDFLFPLFVAMSGRAVSVSVIEAIDILGLDIARARLRHGLAVLGGVSKKQAKNLEKEFRRFNQE
jgi:glutamyl-tRNA synthetase